MYKLNFPFRIVAMLAAILLLHACQKDLDVEPSVSEEEQISTSVNDFVQAILNTTTNPDGFSAVQPGVESRTDLTIVEYLGFKPELSLLLDAIQRVPSVADALDNPDVQVTLFAPTNEAINMTLQQAGYASIDAIPMEALMQILRLHVLPGFMGVPELDMYEKSMLMVAYDGGVAVDLFIEKFSNSAALINDQAPVVRANQFVGRSIVHYVSRVIPPSNLGILIDDNPNFSIFNMAVQRNDLDTNLIEAMMEGGPYTVLVPTDDAFEALFDELGISSINDVPGGTLSQILWYHIVEGNYRADELSMGLTLETTVLGTSYTTSSMNGNVMINGEAMVVRANLQATNGVAHAINTVLMPGDGGNGGGTGDATLYASSNTSGQIGVFDASENGLMMSRWIDVANADADGIYYDEDNDRLYQLDRTNNRVNVYTNASGIQDGSSVSPTFMSSSSDFTNGREIAVSGNRLVVAQDADPGNGDMNKFFVYTITPNTVILSKTFDSPVNLWGIHVEGEDVYAIEDNSDRLVIFEDFFAQPEGMIQPTQTLTIEGIVRTHGITYDAANDIMVLTDVGEASSATDGAIHIIEDFSSKANAAGDMGMIGLGQQTRIAGSNTLLGNPVDVAFSEDLGMIYVAERANGGGRILVFGYPSSGGNIVPLENIEFAGASAVYLEE